MRLFRDDRCGRVRKKYMQNDNGQKSNIRCIRYFFFKDSPAQTVPSPAKVTRNETQIASRKWDSVSNVTSFDADLSPKRGQRRNRSVQCATVLDKTTVEASETLQRREPVADFTNACRDRF